MAKRRKNANWRDHVDRYGRRKLPDGTYTSLHVGFHPLDKEYVAGRNRRDEDFIIKKAKENVSLLKGSIHQIKARIRRIEDGTYKGSSPDGTLEFLKERLAYNHEKLPKAEKKLQKYLTKFKRSNPRVSEDNLKGLILAGAVGFVIGRIIKDPSGVGNSMRNIQMRQGGF